MTGSSTPVASKREHRLALLGQITQALDGQRQRAQEFLTSQKARLADVETRLRGEFDGLSGRLAAWKELQSKTEASVTALRREREELDRLRADSETRRAQLESQQAELTARSRDLDQRQTELDQRQAELDGLKSETEAQRQRIARQLDERRRKLLSDQADGRVTLESELNKLRQELSQAETALEAAQREQRAAELHGKTEQEGRQRLVQELAELRTALDEARHEQQSSEQRAKSGQGEQQRLEAELAQLRSALESLRDEQSAAAEATKDAVDAEHYAELERRYEMAMESVEALRDKNDRLEAELAAARDSQTDAPSPFPAASCEDPDDEGGLDWEAQKRRLLANLETNEWGADDQQKIEDAIRKTDDAIAVKDRELAALREQLAARESAPPPAVAPENPWSELLDKDEVLAAERKKIKQMQTELYEKLREAEVACAKEAQNARMRSELEERMRDVDAELSRLQNQQAKGASGKSSGRRWLDHLGLRKDDEDSSG